MELWQQQCEGLKEKWFPHMSIVHTTSRCRCPFNSDLVEVLMSKSRLQQNVSKVVCVKNHQSGINLMTLGGE